MGITINLLLFFLFSFNFVFGEFMLDDSRRTNWSNAGVYGGIPNISSPVVNVKDFGAVGDGTTDDSAAVANAINSIKSKLPAVVYFPEGTYLLKSKIDLQNLDGIVIRGDGYKKTKLIFDLNGSNSSCIEVLTYRRGNWVSALSGYEKGSTQILVADVSQFKVGDIAEIQQANDSAIMYTNPQWNQSWAENSVGQFFRVVGIDGNKLIIYPPLNISFRADLNPQVRRNNLISNVGFEDFYIERVDSGDGNTFYFKNAANCWIRRVESYNTVKAHVSATSCLNLEIRECYFHHSHRYDGGGHGYGVELGFHVTNCLVENNIFKHLRHSMMVHLGANGNVFGYNYSIEPYQDQDPGVWTPCDISVHGHYPFMNLFEGNIVQEVDCTDYWGPAGPGNTFFRNRVEQEGIEIMDASHYQNIIGNEIVNSTISVGSNINGTLIHGNNIQGLVVWDETLDKDLPASLYKSSKPDFFGNLNWPSIGYPNNINSGTIPAKLRYGQQEYIPTETSSSSNVVNIYVIVNPPNAGSVTIQPSSPSYLLNTQITLTASAANGWRFVRWSGDLNSTQNPISIVLDTNKTIIANFEKVISTFTQKIAIPSYFYPGGSSLSYWQKIINSTGSVGLVVVNPSDGPGNNKDLNYSNIVSSLQSVGIKVVGYVYTNWGGRDINIVKSEVDKHFQWYNLDGIFFDEASDLLEKVTYYQQLYNYVKQTYGTDKIVIINPGINTLEEYINTADIIVNFEDEYTKYINWQPSGWEYKYSPYRFWHLIINTPFENLENAINLSKERNAGWIYVTDDNLPNPWDTIPQDSYWQKELSLVSSSSLITTYYQLTINIIPNNNAGDVLVYPEYSNFLYPAGSTVTLTAQAKQGYKFSNWSGDVGYSTNTTINLIMDTNKLVIANFIVKSTSSVDQPPIINSVNLQNNETISGNFKLIINCEDDNAITKLELYIDGTNLTTLENPPYEYELNTKILSNGEHILLIKAYDNSNQTTTLSINFIVNNKDLNYLKEKYILTLNNDNRNETIELYDEVELIEIYDLKGNKVYETSQKITSLKFLKIGSYIYKAKLKNGEIEFGKLIILK